MPVLEMKSSVTETLTASLDLPPLLQPSFFNIFLFFSQILCLCSGGAPLIALAEFHPLVREGR